MLKLDTVNAYYGDVQVLFDVSLVYADTRSRAAAR